MSLSGLARWSFGFLLLLFALYPGCSFKGNYISGPIGGDAESLDAEIGLDVLEDAAIWESFDAFLPHDVVIGPPCESDANCTGIFGTLESCEAAYCDPASGMCVLGIRQNGSACDDNNPCTDSDRCKTGVCAGGQNLCECDVDADCAVFDDANLCNGRLHCDRSGDVFRCEVDPNSLIACTGEATAACRDLVCDPATGLCIEQDRICPAPNACQMGVCDLQTDRCVGVPRCVAPDPCHEATCEAATGTCFVTPRLCEASTLCHTSTCQIETGTCVEQPRECPQPPPCHDALGCDPGTGMCVVVRQVDAVEGASVPGTCDNLLDDDCDGLTDGDDADCPTE